MPVRLRRICGGNRREVFREQVGFAAREGGKYFGNMRERGEGRAEIMRGKGRNRTVLNI